MPRLLHDIILAWILSLLFQLLTNPPADGDEEER